MDKSYRDHVVRIANDISARHPDVALAVRMPRSSPENEISTEVEEDGEIDEFLSSHGFEFIDGQVEHQRHERAEDEGLIDHGDYAFISLNMPVNLMTINIS